MRKNGWSLSINNWMKENSVEFALKNKPNIFPLAEESFSYTHQFFVFWVSYNNDSKAFALLVGIKGSSRVIIWWLNS